MSIPACEVWGNVLEISDSKYNSSTNAIFIELLHNVD